MFTVYDTNAEKGVAHGMPWPTADGSSAPPGLEEGLVLLEELEDPTPDHDPITQEVVDLGWSYDVQAGTAVRPKHVIDLSLDLAKQRKNDAIDERTRQMISEGFDHDNRHFSLSAQAQMNLDGVQMAAEKSIINFPHKMSTDDDGIEYELADQGALDVVYGKAVGKIKQCMDGGRDLKNAVMAATTVEDVRAVADER